MRHADGPAPAGPGMGAGETGMKAGALARRARGFTIIELMIVVVVVAILAAIAAPIYTQYLVRGQRSAARAVLLQTAQGMERYFTTNGSYGATFPLPSLAFTTGCAAVVPANAASADGVTYCISGVAVGAGSGFQLSATPCGATANCGTGSNTAFNDADCGTLTVDNAGTRGASVGGTALSGAALARCWGS